MVTKQDKSVSESPVTSDEHMLTLGEILADYPDSNTNYAKAKQMVREGSGPYKRAFVRGLVAGLLIGGGIIVALLIVGR